MTRIALVGAAVACLLSVSMVNAAEPLSRPPGLEPEVGFWRSVFTVATTDQVIVHDARHLGVVYETLDFPPGTSDSRRRQLGNAATSRYERILRDLATGRRKGLTPEEQRVLDRWPAKVSNDQLREAAGRVRSQGGLADRFKEGLVRSGRWREHIRVQLRQANVPESLAALPHVESSFNPLAGSSAGAVGIWQFTRGTGQRFMQVDHVVDERRDPFRSSESAARLLRANYAALGSWPLAITAYNHGVAGMRRAVRTLGTNDIETIIRRYDGRAFGFASRNFYVSFLAAEEADREAERYFGPITAATPEPTATIVVPAYLGIAALERSLGVPLETLQAYNPALMPPVWSGQKYVPRGYRLRVPAGLGDTPDALLAAIPPAERFSRQVPDRTHTVRRGESLSTIASRHGTSVSQLARLNGLSGRYLIRAGQTIKLPGDVARSSAASSPRSTAVASAQGSAAMYRVQSGDSLSLIAKRTGISEQQLMALNGLADRHRIVAGQSLRLTRDGDKVAIRRAAPQGFYTVRRGDSLAMIAKKTGVSQRQLLALNDLNNPNRIYPGQQLRISAKDGS